MWDFMNNRTNVRLSILLVAETRLKHSILYNKARIIIDYEIPFDLQGQCETNGLKEWFYAKVIK